jgi:Tol biopolymer transport system component
MKPAALLALAAAAATACGRFGFSSEPALDAAPPDGAPDAIENHPCQSWIWQPVRVLDELNSAATDWSFSWGQGRTQIVFESNRGGNDDLYLTTLDERTMRYRAPRLLDEVNTDAREAAPSLFEDGLELYYDSPLGVMRAVRDAPDARFTTPTLLFEGDGAELGSADLDLIYTVENELGDRVVALRSRGVTDSAQFGPPVLLEYLDLPARSGWPSLSRDGLELYLEIDDEPVHVATRRDRTHQFSTPQPITTFGSGADPDISPDGDWLLYVTDVDTIPMLARRTCLDGA